MDPDTGKTLLMQTTDDGKTILTDPSSGKVFIKTASGRLQELVDEGGILYDASTGINSIFNNFSLFQIELKTYAKRKLSLC